MTWLRYLRHGTTIRKALVALVAFAGVLLAVAEDGRIDADEWAALGSSAAGVVAVFAVPNADLEDVRPSGRPKRTP